MTDMRALIEFASDSMEIWFDKTGAISPMWHVVKRNGEQFVIKAPMFDKDTSALIMRAVFEKYDVVTCLFIDEAWTTEAKGDAEIAQLRHYLETHNHSLLDYPGRIEVVVFQCEDHQQGQLGAERRIIREPGQKPRLGPLVIHEPFTASSGRFVGMLPRKGRAN